MIPLLVWSAGPFQSFSLGWDLEFGQDPALVSSDKAALDAIHWSLVRVKTDPSPVLEDFS